MLRETAQYAVSVAVALAAVFASYALVLWIAGP